MPFSARDSAAMTSNFGSVVANSAANRRRNSTSMLRETRNNRSQSRSFCLLVVSASARSTLAAHVSPPDTDIAWPVIAWAEACHKNSTVWATSVGSTKRPCGLSLAARPRLRR